MRIARLRPRQGRDVECGETYGMVRNGTVLTRDEIMRSAGVRIPRGISDFMFGGAYDEIRGKRLPRGEPISKYEVLAPLPRPGKIVCLAFNYADHAEEQRQTPPDDPVMIIKPHTALAGTGSEILCPDFVKKLDYEVELAVVIGDTCKNVSADSAMGRVFGYMILNDLSARDIQFKDGQFTRGKSFDGFAPCGPWITSADEIPDAHGLRLTTRVNGETRQDSSTGRMYIKIPRIISKISQVMTLEPGDIISTGTPAGVAFNSPSENFLEDGDTISMEIEGLGAICNTIRKVPTRLQ